MVDHQDGMTDLDGQNHMHLVAFLRRDYVESNHITTTRIPIPLEAKAKALGSDAAFSMADREPIG
jgi:hypothetical protein